MLCFHMCLSMRNVSHLGWTSSCWVIHLKSSHVNSMRMSNRFGVSVLSPCRYILQLCNWTVGEARLFWKREHFTYCVACAVALKRTHRTLLHFSASSSGFPCALRALRLAVCSEHVWFSAVWTVLPYGASLPSCTAGQSLSAFSGASLCLMSCYSKTQPMSQECKWEPSSQKPIGCPHPLTFPEGTVNSVEHDLTTGCHSVGDEKLLESGRSTWTVHTHCSQLSTPLQSLASACSDLWGRNL